MITRVKESLYEFEKGLNPVDSLGLGRKTMIEEWLQKNNIDLNLCRINKDYSIDFGDNDIRRFDNHSVIFISGINTPKLPYFIQFNRIYGNFHINNCYLTSFRGFPREIHTSGDHYGCLNIIGNKKMFKSLDYFPEYIKYNFICKKNFIRKFPENIIRSKCQIVSSIIAYR